VNIMIDTVQTYVILGITIVVTLLAAKLGIRLVNRLTRRLSTQGKSPGIVEFAGAVGRILIWLIAVSVILIDVLATFGLRQLLLESVSQFLVSNAGRFGVMLIILIGGYVATRILRIFFAEYKPRTKLHPLTVDLVQSVARYLIYAIVAVLMLTNILVMAGLQTLAGTLVTLFTVFIGLAVSFSATGSIGNVLSGLVLMSWRPYKEGDRVELGAGVYGDVVEVDVMFTKIKTIKDEIVHVPNSQVLGNKVVNYSELNKVIVHYQITIGYDVPRKLVEKLLIRSARLTPNLLPDPEPYVLLRDLNNNYVSYEINAYTDEPNALVSTYSSLMRNILDAFENAGVEILSPQHLALRKSSTTVTHKRRMR